MLKFFSLLRLVYCNSLYIRNIPDSSTPSDDNNLEISEFNLVHSDHPLRNERGGVCAFYKSFLSLRILNVQ